MMILKSKFRFVCCFLGALSCGFEVVAAETEKRKNVLLIAIDDLNDWVGVLGGHPQVKTPNIDRLASKGVLFTNAHCQAPVCNPSRASMMTSLYPETTGIYFLNPYIKKSKAASKNMVLPLRFHKEGYAVAAAGKLFHGQETKEYFPEYAGSFGGFGPLPKKRIGPFKGIRLWDWGAFPAEDALMPDVKIAKWAERKLNQKQKRPFLYAAGFYRPHVPQFVPKKWFEMYPIDKVQLPEVHGEDLKDIPKYGYNLTNLKHIAPIQAWVEKEKQWKPLVQSYLACVSFVDAQVGKVVDALEKSGNAENTYIVLYSDHGFHLGEKRRWAKRSLWRDSTRVPMIIVGPGIKAGQVCGKPVQLMDIYPTLLELVKMKADTGHQGNSLVSLLNDPEGNWPHMARCSFGPGNYSIISENYRYIHYNDGSEEFYNVTQDPHEWKNVVRVEKYAKLIDQHRTYAPKKFADALGKRSTGHLAFEAAEELKEK